ncbi:acyl-CoA dehydrogenase domain-containing protein [mine drainage metagenome]|uniref:Acyl-CoA dehydrogenase domain-containing protein n=2 Tax=mine drainage metagenome TaxID=410659 RepID=T1DEP7_9ZZZZ
MTKYAAPLEDMRFALYDVLDAERALKALPRGEALNRELIDAVLDEAARFSEQVLAPLNQSGDAEGCHYDKASASVTTPAGFKDANAQFVAGGWAGLTAPEAYGGQDLPETIGALVKEMLDSANLSWSNYPLLSAGATEALLQHGEEWQREVFLKPIVAGRWTGTMCLTEPHCGTDLGLLKTAPNRRGRQLRISGTKIFITGGEQDLSENIVHLVLARLPDAPTGTRGISMFVVPKFKVARDGTVGERNNVACGSIEHKMGIKGSSTCVMNFDGAEGYRVGPPHKGLMAMFTMMNAARLAVGIQGLGLIERAYQNSLAYARERLQMRALGGAKFPAKPADPIIVHADVRRMLLTQKAIAEAGRVLVLHAALLGDTNCAAPMPRSASAPSRSCRS